MTLMQSSDPASTIPHSKPTILFTIDSSSPSSSSAGDWVYKPLPLTFAPKLKRICMAESMEVKPIGVGEFGEIYDQFIGKTKEAIEFLLSKKGGEALGALYHINVGDISLVYGTDDYGLKKIVTKHPEVIDGLQEKVAETTVISKSENRIVLESELHKVVVSKMLGDCTTNPWILTAYKKKGCSCQQ